MEFADLRGQLRKAGEAIVATLHHGLAAFGLAVLLFVAVNRMFVRPIRRISHNMESFADAPQDPRDCTLARAP